MGFSIVHLLIILVPVAILAGVAVSQRRRR